MRFKSDDILETELHFVTYTIATEISIYDSMSFS